MYYTPSIGLRGLNPSVAIELAAIGSYPAPVLPLPPLEEDVDPLPLDVPLPLPEVPEGLPNVDEPEVDEEDEELPKLDEPEPALPVEDPKEDDGDDPVDELPNEEEGEPEGALPNPDADPEELDPDGEEPDVELPLDVLLDPISGICWDAFIPIPLAKEGAAPPPPNPELAALGSYLAPVLMELLGS